MKIAIGNDHAAVEMKQEIKNYLEEKGHTLIDYGTNSIQSVHYPDFAKSVALGVTKGEAHCGILICGTGIGISIAANKIKGIRCALCSEPVSARLSKEHNNANIIAFGARVIGVDMAKAIVDAWLGAEFLEGRHQERVDMIER